MAEQLNEVTCIPTEATAGEEYLPTPEAAETPAEQCVPEEDRTFASGSTPSETKKRKKSKKLTAAAIFAAAGLTAFAGIAATTQLQQMQPQPTEPTALTETVTETTAELTEAETT